MEELNTQKLYTQKGISIATFIGGPLAAGYLIRHNFIILGKEKEGLFAIILGILFTAVIFIPLFMMPEEIVEKIPNQVIPAIYTLIIYGIVELTQGKNLKNHKEIGGTFKSNWNAIGVGFLWMLVLAAMFFIYVFSSPDISTKLDEEISQKMEQIAINEEKALSIYNLSPNTPKDELLKAVKNEGIFYWNINLQLLQEIQEYELEETYAKYVNKLFIYTRIRQETYLLLMKSLEEDTDKYNSEIEQKNKSIQSILEEINQMTL